MGHRFSNALQQYLKFFLHRHPRQNWRINASTQKNNTPFHFDTSQAQCAAQFFNNGERLHGRFHYVKGYSLFWRAKTQRR